MIRRQVVMPVTPERLWARSPIRDQMAGWFGAGSSGICEPGAPARFHGDDGSERAGRVEAVRPGRHSALPVVAEQEPEQGPPTVAGESAGATGCPRSATSSSLVPREPASPSRSGRSTSPAGAGPQARPGLRQAATG